MDSEAPGGGLDGVEEGSDGGAFTSLASLDPETKHKLYGSEPASEEDDDWRRRSYKMARTTDKMLLQQRGNGLVLRSASPFSDAQPQHQQMLSFSCSPRSEAMLMERSSKNAALSCFQRSSTPGRYSGYSSGSLTGVRGPFTPSQWMELEHQALIYKYITANMPIPSNLLNPIKRSLDSLVFSPFSSGSLTPTTLGWGSFHLGFSNSMDPEPGRCRRTDGKKWRCSRDAVADAKYCERHMNRGRHRSRKPVEGRTGHSAANVQHQVKNPTAAIHPGRIHLKEEENVGERMENTASLSMLSPTMNLKCKEKAFSTTKQQPLYQKYSQTQFGLVSCDSLLNPSQGSSSFMNYQNSCSSQDREPESQHSLRPFMDNWPKPEIGSQLDRTQPSNSTSPASSGLMSTSSYPTNSKVTLSPLRLSCQIDPIQMGLGVGSVNEPNAKWWGTSVGGPLGEVLHSTNNSSGSDCKNSSALNLMRDGSPRLGSSPTGVLQKTAFGSLSNSSAGSSPRTHEGASLCSDMLGTSLVYSSSLPLL